MQYTFFKREHIFFSSDQPAKAILIDTFPGWGSNHFHVSQMMRSANVLFSFISNINVCKHIKGCLWVPVEKESNQIYCQLLRDWTASDLTSALVTSTCFKVALKVAQNGNAVSHQPQPCQAKVGQRMQKRVIWKKNAALVTCSSLCACSHVIIHSPIKSTLLHTLGATYPVPVMKVVQSGWCGSGFFLVSGGDFHVLWVTVCFCRTKLKNWLAFFFVKNKEGFAPHHLLI